MNSSERAAIALAGSNIATQAAERLLFDAITEGALALHLEPHGNQARIRYRIDGLLHEWSQLSEHALTTLIAHFKHRAGLLPDERRWSQEGHFHLRIDGISYNVKITTLPLAVGEKAVLHIFDGRKASHDVVELGVWGDTRKRLGHALTARQGLIVVSGARHSGVSTTLRSLLNALNKPSHSVISIDDRTGHHLTGVQQLRIDRRQGHDLPHHLATAVASDANTIHIGSLHGTAATGAALEATSKGRLVLAGMHSGSLLQTMSQLKAATNEHYLLAHNLQAVLHQQLVRRLCEHCKLPAKPNAQQLRTITTKTRITVASLQRFMEETRKHLPETKLQLFQANPKGCSYCRYTGYKGRIGLFELFTPTAASRPRLGNHTHPATILHHAVKEGMMPLVVDGLVKALCGLTTMEEVLASHRGKQPHAH